jgi:GNAT superfamily N-acetyltransferase
LIDVRPMTAGDLDAGLRLSRLSNWNQVAGDWLCLLDSPAGSGWIAEDDSMAVGTVALLRYAPSFAWLSMMLVDPARRRSGIGWQLMETALAALADEACVRLDATPAGEPLYRRFGFVPEYSLVRATAPGLSIAAPSNVRRMTSGDLDCVFAHDREVFGADRSAILASLYGRASALAAITPGGYCFGRPGHRYHQMGPVVATSADVAAALVSHCRVDGPVAIDVPRDRAKWVRWLESVGFTVERPFLRMRRGGNAEYGEPSRQLAIVGPEFG